MLALAMIVGAGLYWTYTNSQPTVRWRDQNFNLIIADSDSERVQGLSGRAELAKDEAMLFVFEESARWGIWMKDMNFAIDIVWLDEHKQVVHIERQVEPDTYPQVFTPTTDSRYVVEFPAGTVDSLGVKNGDSLDF